MRPNSARAGTRRLATCLLIVLLVGSSFGVLLSAHQPVGAPLRTTPRASPSSHAPGSYPIRLQAVGMPNGTPWSLEIGGTDYRFTNNSATVYEPNGTYAYHLGSVNGWVSAGSAGAESSGTILVDGAQNGIALRSLGLGVGADPTGIAYVPNTTSLYVTSSYYDTVIRITAASLPWHLKGNLSVGSLPSAIAWDGANGTLWVTNAGSDNLTVLDPSTDQVVVPSIGVGTDPIALAVDPHNGEVFVVNAGSDNVTVINGTSYRIVHPGISVGQNPTAITYASTTGDLFVANTGANTVSVLNGSTGSVVGRPIPVGTSPSGLAADPTAGTIFVTNSGSSNLTVLNASTRRVVVGSVAVGGGPIAPVFDPQNGDLYVPNQGTDNLTVIDPGRERSVVPSIGTGPSPDGATYIAGTGFIPVLSSGGNNLSVINGNGELRFVFRAVPQYPVQWTAEGLPAGTPWSVALEGTTYRSTGTTLTIPISNGTFSYTLNPVIDYQPVGVPVHGNLSVVGGEFFTPSPSIPVGTLPNVGVYDHRTGNLYLANVGDSNLSVVNATTYRSVTTVSLATAAAAMAFDPANGFIYVGYASSSVIGVLNGSDNGWITNFSAASSESVGGSVSWITYDPYNQFLYASLTSGYVAVFNGSTNASLLNTISVGYDPVGSAVDPATHDLWVADSGSNQISIVRLNGTNGTAEPYAPESSSQPWVVVADPPLNRMIVSDGNFGHPGNVSVYSESNPNVTSSFLAPAGPYSMAIDPTGRLLVASQRVNVLTLFSGRQFGLHQSWPGISDYPTFVLYDPAAHAFLVANYNDSNWTVLTAHTTFAVDWGPAPEYPVVFAETGLPHGAAWQVTLAGSTERTTNSTIRFSISAGVFPYQIQGPAGYRIGGAPSDGSVTVNGLPANLAPSGVGVGTSPDAAAYDPATGQLYVANSQSGNLTVVNPQTMRSSGGSFPVGAAPSAVACDPVTGDLFVANARSDNLTVIDPVGGRTVANVSVQNAPMALAYDPLIQSVVVADSGSNNLTIVNGSTLQVTQNVSSGGSEPVAVAYDPTGQSLVILDAGSGRVVRLDAGNLTPENNASLYLYSARASGLSIDNQSGAVVIASDSTSSGGLGTLTVLNATLARLTAVPLGGVPLGLVWDPAHGQIDVAEPSSGQVAVYGGNLSAASIPIASVRVGVDPTTGVYVPATREVAILNSGGRNLSVVGRGARVGLVGRPIPKYPVELQEYGLLSGSLWTVVLNGTRFSTRNSTMTIELPNGSYPYRFLPVAGMKLLGPAAEGTVRVEGVPGQILASGWAGGASPSAVAFDPKLGALFVTDRANDSVTILNVSTGRIEGSVRVGDRPEAIVYLAAQGRLVVANSGSDNLTVLNANDGAPLGSPIPVGSSPRALLWDPSAGLLVVADYGGSNLTLVNLSLGRPVGSLPVGLDPVALALDPSTGRVFTVNVGSGNVTGVNPSAPTVPAINVPVGADPHSIAFDPATQQFWITDFGNGNLTLLNGTTPALAPVTLPIGAYPDQLTFDPVNGYLYLTVGVARRVVAIDGISHEVVASDLLPSESVAFVTYLPGNGNLAAVDSTGGTVALINGLGPLTALFATYLYPVSFVSVGRPTGVPFVLDLNTSSYASVGSNLTVELGNGSYAFRVEPIPGWSVAPAGGTVTVNGSGESVVLTFSRVTYAVTVDEVGLPNGTLWGVDFNGTVASTTAAFLTWSVPNGSYPFRIVGVPGWATTGYVGTLGVNGSVVRVTVRWTQVTYPVVVTVQGIPNGTPWTLYVNGQPFPSNTTSLTLDLPNGSYALGVRAPPGYQIRAPPGNLTLSGAAPPAPVVVGFIPVTSPPPTTSGWVWAVVATGLAAVVVLLAWWIVRRRRSNGRSPP
ncbi:MAG: YncE family protein [Thermoplasmata archaeon]